MESFEPVSGNTPERPLSVIADIISEYESRPGRPKGHIVCRLVAESEPEVLEQIATATGLTEAELWRHINETEERAGRPPREFEAVRREITDRDRREHRAGQVAEDA